MWRGVSLVLGLCGTDKRFPRFAYLASYATAQNKHKQFKKGVVGVNVVPSHHPITVYISKCKHVKGPRNSCMLSEIIKAMVPYQLASFSLTIHLLCFDDGGYLHGQFSSLPGLNISWLSG